VGTQKLTTLFAEALSSAVGKTDTVLLLIGALPAWPYSSGWGYYPTGGLGLLLVVVLVLVLLGRV
jgi:hypothetical protein